MANTVVFLLKGYPRLSETFIAQEILGLEQSGLDIRIVSLRRPTDKTIHPVNREIKAPVAYLPEYLHEEPRRVLSALVSALIKPAFWAVLPTFLADLARDFSRNRFRRLGQALVLCREMPEGVRALHAHFIHTPASVAFYASRMTGLKFSCSAHAKDIWTTPPRELAKKLKAARWTVTCTKAGCDYLDTLAPPEKPVTLIYHGLDLTRFSPMTAPRSGRDGGADGPAVELLSVGRAVEKKGFDNVIAALALLPQGINWRWTHIGGGGLSGALRAQAAALGLEARMNFAGAQDQAAVLGAYRASDIFVLPCRIAGDGDRDGLPNVLVEAQSQGLACVSTPVAAIPELIESGVTGLLVPPDDVPVLAAALQKLIADPALRRSLGDAGARRVRARFGHGEGIARLRALFAP